MRLMLATLSILFFVVISSVSAQEELSPTWILPLAPAGYGGPGVINPYSNVNPLNPMAAEMQARAAGKAVTQTPQEQLGPASGNNAAVQAPTQEQTFLETEETKHKSRKMVKATVLKDLELPKSPSLAGNIPLAHLPYLNPEHLQVFFLFPKSGPYANMAAALAGAHSASSSSASASASPASSSGSTIFQQHTVLEQEQFSGSVPVSHNSASQSGSSSSSGNADPACMNVVSTSSSSTTFTSLTPIAQSVSPACASASSSSSSSSELSDVVSTSSSSSLSSSESSSSESSSASSSEKVEAEQQITNPTSDTQPPLPSNGDHAYAEVVDSLPPKQQAWDHHSFVRYNGDNSNKGFVVSVVPKGSVCQGCAYL